MGVYLKELSPIEGAEGNLMMTMLIEQSFSTKSVYFEAYESDQDWILYWSR